MPLATESRRIALLTLALGLPLGLTAPLLATEWIVEDEIDLFGAFQLAQHGDTISIQPGAYTLTQTLSVNDIAITIRGVGAGPAQTTLNGNDLIRILEISGAGANGTRLENLTFLDGHSIGTVSAPTGGGAVFATDTAVVIDRCIFDDNEATNTLSEPRGGAILGLNTDMTVTDTTFRNNTVYGLGSDGGAIALFGAQDHLFADCVFENNTARNTGGGMRIDAATAQLTRCLFVDNQLVDDGSDRFGGGLFLRSGALITVDHCSFVNNEAREGGGIGSLDTNVDLLVRNSEFQGNVGVLRGGAIENSGVLMAMNCTFEGNTAPTESVVHRRSGSGVASLVNSIVWNNLPVAGQFTPGTSARYSIVQGGYAGAGNVDADPMFLDAASGDLAVAPGSPAIDAGSTDLYMGPFIDLAGNPRGTDDPDVVDTGASVAGAVIDMGAFERAVVEAPGTCPGDLDGDGTIGFGDLLAILSAWGACP